MMINSLLFRYTDKACPCSGQGLVRNTDKGCAGTLFFQQFRELFPLNLVLGGLMASPRGVHLPPFQQAPLLQSGIRRCGCSFVDSGRPSYPPACLLAPDSMRHLIVACGIGPFAVRKRSLGVV